MVENIIDWFSGASDGVAEAVCNAFSTCISVMVNAALSMLAVQLGWLPAISWPFTSTDLSNFAAPLAAWNTFFPITEGLLILVGFCSFSLIFALIKILVKLIPTVG